MHRPLSFLFVFVLLLGQPAPVAGAAAAPTLPSANDLRISQVYGGGGNSGATLKNDFIEIFNSGPTSISVTGYSVQYASSTGTSWQVTTLAGSIGPGQYYLVQEAAGSGGTVNLPTPDATGSIAMSGSSGKVALVSSATALTGSCPTTGVVDLVGYGTSANCSETAPTATLSNTTAAVRASNGCTDTDNNGSDFATGAPAPRNTASPTKSCGAADSAPTVTSTNPVDIATSVAVDASLTITFSEDVAVAADWYTISCTASSSHTAALAGGPGIWTLDPVVDFANSETCTVTIHAAKVTDLDANDPPDAMAADYSFSFTTVAPADDVPAVTTTSPTNGATDIPVAATLTVNFSEPVDVAAGGVTLDCPSGSPVTLGDLPATNVTSVVLTPAVALPAGTICTATVLAAAITDVDANDPPDTLAADVTWSFTTAAAPPAPVVLINELDADTPSTDVAEFIELYDGGAGNTDLTGLVLVLYNGSNDLSYAAFDLDGRTTDAAGYLVLCGNAANVANCDWDVLPDQDLIQNGQDAAALYTGDATAFPTGTAVTTANLLDAIVYDTADADDPGLLVLLNAGQPQVDENGGANGAGHSNQRCPNGSGGARNTTTYAQYAPTPGALNICTVPDLAPTVTTTAPASNATNVATNSNVSVTFSEPVTTGPCWYDITCVTSGSHTAAQSGGPTTFTLNPDADFTAGESCTVTVYAAQIADQDGTPTLMATNYAWSFTTAAADICADPFTPIYNVQGSGATSPLANTTVTIEGIVVGDFQGAAGHYGFYVQDPTGDANTLTSDGVFVYVPDANAFASINVAVGDEVHLSGTVKEFNGLTEFDNLTALKICGAGSVAATVVDLPETANGDLERYEGMLITIPETLTVSQNYFQGRYGQVTLSSDGRMYNPTNGNGLGDTFELDARRILVLDDGFSGQNPNPTPYMIDDNTLRAGDTTTGLTGTLDYGPINSDTTIRDYRLQPTASVTFTRVNNRTGAPASVGGNVKVASFNVLNYFNGDGAGGGFPTSRGANTAAEFTRQRNKIIAALTAINADVVGLMEIERDGYGAASAVQDLVNGLNAATTPGTYAFVAPSTDPGTDEITVAMIYKPASVTPVGAGQFYQTTTAAYSPLFDRPPLAQTFATADFGEHFTVVVNHFKSKGSCPASGPDTDQGDGQGCWNAKRVAQATGLLDFIAQLKTSTGDPDVLVIGDLNAYGTEDPILTLTAGGLVNEVANVPAASRYSYIFDGFSGYLDHGLATPELSAQVTGRTVWHINADEPSVIDYNTEFKPQDLYTATPYRSSDHDPVIVGLGLLPDQSDAPAGYTVAWHTGQGALRLGSAWTHEAIATPGGDDASDDGVTVVPSENWTSETGGQVNVTASGSGFLSAWADWNNDNDFADAGEQILTNAAVTAGAQELSFSIPAGVTVTGAVNLRFRLYAAAQTATPAPDGQGDGGEVEDYTWSFGPNAVSVLGFTASAAPAGAWSGLLAALAATAVLVLRRFAR